MLTVTLDTSLLLDFIKSQPRQIPLGSLEDNIYWNSFWKFLKTETHLQISNFNNIADFRGYDLFLTQLTSGRNDSLICTSESPFMSSHDYIFAQDVNPNSCFFLNEPNITSQENFRKNNGYFFSFLDDYKEQYGKLALLKLTKSLIIRNNIAVNNLKEWSGLSPYLSPFTDMIFIDNYIFSEEKHFKNNLIPLLKTLDDSTPVAYNLMFISHEDSAKGVNVNTIFERLEEIKLANNLKFILSVFIPRGKFKEHDRGIFMNYLRIRSGDSFNYFGENGQILTKGTDIEFYPYTESENAINSSLILKNIRSKIIRNTHTRGATRGTLYNRLLEIT